MSRPTAFPWTSEGKGLCNVLRDAELWVSALKDQPEFCNAFMAEFGPWSPRRTLASAKLRAQARGHMPDPKKLGSLLVEVLADPRKRKRLNEPLKVFFKTKGHWRHFLGCQLLRFLADEYPTIFQKDGGPDGQFHVKPLEADLKAPEIPATERRPRALAVFALALGSGELGRGREQLAYTWDNHVELRIFLCEGEVPAIQDHGHPVPAHPAEKQDELAPGPVETALAEHPCISDASSSDAADPFPSIDIGVDSTQSVTLAQQRAIVLNLQTLIDNVQKRQQLASAAHQQLACGDASVGLMPLNESMSAALARLDELDTQIEGMLNRRVRTGAQVLGRLEQRLQRQNASLQQFDDDRSRLGRQFDEIACLPWWKTAPTTSQWLEFSESTTLPQAQGAVDALRADVSRILQSDSSLRDLHKSLGSVPAPFISSPGMRLGAIADCVEQHVRSFRERFEALAAQEQVAADFLGNLAAVVSRASAVRFLQETSAEKWAAVGRLLICRHQCTEAGRQCEMVVGRFDIAGLLVAHLWQLDVDAACAVAAVGLVPPERRRNLEVLRFLSFGQLQELAERQPATAPVIADLIFANALLAPEPTALVYLEPLVSSAKLPEACANLYQACIDEWTAGGTVNMHGFTDAGPPAADAFARQAEHHRQGLLQFIQQKPTMSRNYLRLRLLARALFLEPLVEALRADAPEHAWKQWQGAGSVDGMVAACVRQLQSGPRQKLDQSHSEQTRRYLESFEKELRQWCDLRRQPAQARIDRLRPTFLGLRDDAQENPHGGGAWTLETIRRIRDNEFGEMPAADFGQRVTDTDDGCHLLVGTEELLSPLLTWTWPLALKHGAVPLDLTLADLLRASIGAGPQTLAGAVEEYWEQGEFLAAREASADDPALRSTIAARLGQKKIDLTRAHEELLKEAQSYQQYEKDIDFWCQEIIRAVDELEFVAIPDLLRELENAAAIVRARRDPVRLALLDFLRKADLTPDELATRETLQRQVDGLRAGNIERRRHLLELEKAGGNPLLPEDLRTRWAALARSLDWPDAWPTDEAAFHVSWAIEQFVAFLAGHLQDRESDKDQVDLLVRSFIEWVPRQCEIDPRFASPAGAEALGLLKKLAQDIDAHRTFSVLRTLGCSVPPFSTPAAAAPRSAADVVPSEFVAPASKPPPRLEQPIPGNGASSADHRERVPDDAGVNSKLRRFLGERMRGENSAVADAAQLRSAVRNYRWKASCELAAALVPATPVAEDQPLSDVETVYAIALAHAIAADDPDSVAVQQYACLAVLAVDRSQLQYYLPSTALRENEFAARAVVLACCALDPTLTGGTDSTDQLGQVLHHLIETAPTTPAAEWFRELFWLASRLGPAASARLGDYLWEALRGKDNDESRACLLRLLFRMRRGETLRRLARHSEPIDDLIKVCLSAFEQADEDSSVRLQAREILITLREQAYGKRNTRPWINLFQHLEASRGDAIEPAVSVALQSDRLTDAGRGGAALVQVVFTPSLIDPPRSLTLQFQADPARDPANPAPVMVVSEEEMLLRPRTLEVQIPGVALTVTGEVIGVSYRLVGETILRKPVDVTGHWTFPNTYEDVRSLAEDQIASTWPGASGDPVYGADRTSGPTPARGFYGREDEKSRIERYLRAPGRGRSLMVYGQRRIGKTSLLLEMVRNYPPRKGAICGAFFDLNSLATPAGPGEMQGGFFEFIVSKLTTEPMNAPLWHALRQVAGRDLTPDALGRGFKPKVALEDALEGLVQRLESLSNGLISRMALFIDEFDLFVEPLLSGQREEVLKLHGSLRQIIQRSQRITLVLAGSGLNRLFTEDYLHPFYGSIDELEVKPFDWAVESGRRAIEETFLPRSLRPQLCPVDRFSDVACRAADLTGGHPYYLSMLGFAAARAWRGHPLTPSLLNRIADLLIRNKIDAGTFDVNRRKFYQPVLESLKRLSKREQTLSRLMLASIARLTSTDRQRWNRWRLIEDQSIEDPETRRLTGEDERLAVLKHLEKERIVDVDRSKGIRISIPMAAAAIREDAREMYDEAMRELRGWEGKATR